MELKIMIKKRSLFVGMMFVGQMLQAQDEDIQIAEGPFEPTRKSLAKSTVPEWVQDAKLGFWSHWGPQAVPGQGDWYAKHMYNPEHRHYKYHVETYGHPSKVGYKDVVQQWKAEKFTPEYADYLMKLFQDAGAKLHKLIITIILISGIQNITHGIQWKKVPRKTSSKYGMILRVNMICA